MGDRHRELGAKFDGPFSARSNILNQNRAKNLNAHSVLTALDAPNIERAGSYLSLY